MTRDGETALPDPAGRGRAMPDRRVAEALAAAEERCAAGRLRFTASRRRAFEILLRERRPIGAYAMLDRLRESGLGTHPPAAYRALDFLVAHGFAHKIRRLNAFVACARPGHAHTPIILICRACEAVEEARFASAAAALAQAAGVSGFRAEQAALEAEGLCAACVGEAPA